MARYELQCEGETFWSVDADTLGEAQRAAGIHIEHLKRTQPGFRAKSIELDSFHFSPDGYIPSSHWKTGNGEYFLVEKETEADNG
jgi:hypothetical protein